MNWREHVTCICRRKVPARFWWDNINGDDHWEDIKID
jgi:hypothetical protein